ncbi:MAG: DUF3604 domain-containing protein [Candidatus Eisenbacteria bacterium]|nr:DUF3604 domain-containing protein [Candidatus Eisenbacteria bacterium]
MKRMLLVVLLLSCARTDAPEPADPSAEDGRGTAVMIPAEPVVAGSLGTWDIIYRTGREGLPPGGGIVLQISPFWKWSPPQISHPDMPGFCSVSSAAPCSLVPFADPARNYVLVEVRGDTLRQGEEVTIRYGDTGGGVHPAGSAQVEPYAEQHQEFFVKTDGDGDGVFGEISRQPGLRVIARPAVTLWVNAPSLVSPGQEFEVTVAALDEAGNCDGGYVGVIALSSDGQASAPPSLELTPVDRGASRFAATIPVPGLVVFHVSDSLSGMRASSNPILCGSGGVFHRVFWGDIHGHTGLSDGTGTPGDYYRYARDTAGLDVASVTDHDAWGFRPLRGGGWDSVTTETSAFHAPGRFVTLLGYEWTSWTYGHRNVYFPGEAGAVFPFDDAATDTPEELWAAIKPWNAITVAHHVGGGPVGTDWSHHPPPEQEMLVEVYSVHGNSECFGCAGMIYSPAEGKFVQDALARGYRLGLIASGDGHVGHPGRWSSGNTQGLVAFQADTLTREAIWGALTSRHVYGTSGARILLQFTVGGSSMGDVLPDSACRGPRSGTLAVLGTAPVEHLEIIKNGSVHRAFSTDGLVERVDFTDSSAATPGDYYYARVRQADGHQAWSSPVWVGNDR